MSENAKTNVLVLAWVVVLIVIGFSLGILLGYLTLDHKAEASVTATIPATDFSSEAPIEDIDEVKSRSTPKSTPKPEPTYTLYDVPFNKDTQLEIIEICNEYDISYELILGVISVECTTFEPNTIGDGGNSFGLMQIQSKWWSDIMTREGVTNLLDPLQNIRCGCAIINELKRMYGTEYRALQAYNTGRPDTNNGYADNVYRSIGELSKLKEG